MVSAMASFLCGKECIRRIVRCGRCGKMYLSKKVCYYRRVCKIKLLKYNLTKRRSVERDLDILESNKNPSFSRDSFCFGRFEWRDQAGNMVDF